MSNENDLRLSPLPMILLARPLLSYTFCWFSRFFSGVLNVEIPSPRIFEEKETITIYFSCTRLARVSDLQYLECSVFRAAPGLSRLSSVTSKRTTQHQYHIARVAYFAFPRAPITKVCAPGQPSLGQEDELCCGRRRAKLVECAMEPKWGVPQGAKASRRPKRACRAGIFRSGVVGWHDESDGATTGYERGLVQYSDTGRFRPPRNSRSAQPRCFDGFSCDKRCRVE